MKSPIEVTCPNCQSKPGHVCTQPTETGRTPVKFYHDSRVLEARETSGSASAKPLFSDWEIQTMKWLVAKEHNRLLKLKMRRDEYPSTRALTLVAYKELHDKFVKMEGPFPKKEES